MNKKLVNLSPKNIFLIDGLGGLLTFFNLALVLPYFSEFVGLPIFNLYLLAAIGLLYSSYSLSCFVFFPKNWQRFLRIIAVANWLYMLATLLVLLYHYSLLQWGAYLYFSLEFFIIMILARLELQKAKTS